MAGVSSPQRSAQKGHPRRLQQHFRIVIMALSSHRPGSLGLSSALPRRQLFVLYTRTTVSSDRTTFRYVLAFLVAYLAWGQDLSKFVPRFTEAKIRACFTVQRLKANKNASEEARNAWQFSYENVLAKVAATRSAVETGDKSTIIHCISEFQIALNSFSESVRSEGISRGEVLDGVNAAIKALAEGRTLLVRFLDNRKADKERIRKALQAELSWKHWNEIDSVGKACSQ